MTDFALIVATEPTPQAAAARRRLVQEASARGLREVANNAVGTFLVAGTEKVPRAQCGHAEGFVIGDARVRDASALPSSRERDGGALSSELRKLLDTLWGSFVFVLLRQWPEPAVDIACSPLGQMRAYVFDFGRELKIYTSSLEIGLDLLPRRPRIDVPRLGNFLARSMLPSRNGCLSEVQQLLPGTIDHCSSNGSRTALWWDPWRFAKPMLAQWDCPSPDELRIKVVECVAASLNGRKPLLELSGGLDSSIIAYALKAAGAEFDAATLVSSAADGDERGYARIAAKQAGVRHVELQMDTGDVRLDRVPKVKTIRPGPHLLAAYMDELLREAASKLGSDSFFSGGGGDNLFFATQSVVPIIDRWRHSRSPAATWQATKAIAAITGASWGEVALRSVYRSWWLDRHVRWDVEGIFLPADLPISRRVHHPWLENADRSVPGKCRHVRSLIGILSCLDGHAREQHGPLHFPLLAQPLVEHCLAIPSWLWIQGGRDRAHARTAFEGHLPPPLLARRQKGALDGMFGQLYVENRKLLRDRLLGGFLAEQRLIDTTALEAYFCAPGIVKERLYNRVLELAGFENWCRSWQ